jgi:hypothetical protein
MAANAEPAAQLVLRDGLAPVSAFVEQMLSLLLADYPTILDISTYQHDESISLFVVPTTEADR